MTSARRQSLPLTPGAVHPSPYDLLTFVLLGAFWVDCRTDSWRLVRELFRHKGSHGLLFPLMLCDSGTGDVLGRRAPDVVGMLQGLLAPGASSAWPSQRWRGLAPGRSGGRSCPSLPGSVAFGTSDKERQCPQASPCPGRLAAWWVLKRQKARTLSEPHVNRPTLISNLEMEGAPDSGPLVGSACSVWSEMGCV